MQPIHSFAIKTPKDFLQKLGRERMRFKEASSFNSPEHKYQYDHAINFCLTAWHMVDWVWKYLEINNKDPQLVIGCASYNDFHNRVRSECLGLQVCYEIANGSKHFLATKLKDPLVVSTKEQIYDTDGLTQPLFRPIVRPINRPLVKKHHAGIQILVKDKGRYRFNQICDMVWEYWSNFLEKSQI